MGLPLKIDRSTKTSHAMAGGGIEILHPGLLLGRGDSGVGAIGRIDHARLAPGKIVKMHPHRDDEILTYIRRGAMLHRDTVGDSERVTSRRLMLMNAGHTFQHEEEMLGPGPIEALQIFMRPRAPDLEPLVQFHAFPEEVSADAWRLVAGPEGQAPLMLRAQAWIRDMRLAKGRSIAIPDADTPDALRLLYVFAGRATVGSIALGEGDGLLLDAASYTVEAGSDTDLVLFTTAMDAPVFAGGMFSGNVLGD